MSTKIFYIYVYLDLQGIPFYVGKGQGHRYKIWDHLGRSKSNPFLQSKIKKIGVENIKIEFPLKNASEEDALAYEELFIGIVGRKDQGKGLLCNLTDGGESWSPSEEIRRKISISLKGKMVGRKNPNYGKPMTEKQKNQISAALKCRKHSEETKRKISEAGKGRVAWNKGKKLSKEHKRKMSEAHKGNLGYWTGKKLSKEHKQKMSKALEGKSPWNKGKKLGPRSGETKRKISEGHRRRRRI